MWGQATQTALWPLLKLQKRSIRTICNLRNRDSTMPSFHKLKILRLPDIYRFSILVFMYKYKNNLLPATFDKFYQENKDFHRYPTRGASNLRPPKVKSKLSNSFIRKAGVLLWNEFSPKIIHHINFNIGSFKRQIKGLFINKYLE